MKLKTIEKNWNKNQTKSKTLNLIGIVRCTCSAWFSHRQWAICEWYAVLLLLLCWVECRLHNYPLDDDDDARHARVKRQPSTHFDGDLTWKAKRHNFPNERYIIFFLLRWHQLNSCPHRFRWRWRRKREKVKFKIERERRALVSFDRSIDRQTDRSNNKNVMDVRSTFVAFQDHKSNEWEFIYGLLTASQIIYSNE